MAEYLEQNSADVAVPAPESVAQALPAAPVVNEMPGHSNGSVSRHAAAGRKGAERIHQLIERGKLYEQEHDLKRGRQRLRQLIEEGKLYEQEHGLSTSRRKKRGAPVSPEQ